MSSHPYDAQNFDPSAAAIKIIINNRNRNKQERGILALIDSGADSSAIPREIARRLELQPHDYAEQLDFEGRSHGWKPVYYTDLSFNSFTFNDVEVDEKDDELFILGRDVLNRLKLILDGKALSFTLEG